MAVDTAGMSAVYDSLVKKLQGTLDTEFEKNRISGAEYAQVLSSGIVAVLEMSVQSVQNQEKLDAEITSMGIADEINQAKAEKDNLLKDAQKALIDKQVLTEEEKKELTIRQKAAYDDKLRIEEANALANVTGMFGAGGTALPEGLETAMLDAIAAVTP